MHNDLKQLADQILDAEARVRDERAFVADLYKQVKAKGFDTKILKRAITLISKGDIEKAAEEIQLLDNYLDNMGQGRLL